MHNTGCRPINAMGSHKQPACILQVYATLQQHALSDSQHALMMPAHMLGQSESKRQQLRRALHHQQAGLALPEGSQLERERHVEAAELDPLSAAQVHVIVYIPIFTRALGNSILSCLVLTMVAFASF